jgi:hypothetical protein
MGVAVWVNAGHEVMFSSRNIEHDQWLGGLAIGKYVMPGTPLAGEQSAEEIRRIATGLE